MLSTRQRELIRFLQTMTQKIRIKDLAVILSVSYKSVQNDIQNINREAGYPMIAGDRDGVGLEGLEREEVQAILQAARENPVTDLTMEACSQRLLLNLGTKAYIRKEDFQDTYLLSASRMNEVLKAGKEAAAQFNLRVESRPRYGLYLSGLEEDLRILLRNTLLSMEEKQWPEAFANLSILKELQTFLQNEQVSLSWDNLKELQLMIAIVKIRNEAGNSVLVPDSKKKYLEAFDAFQTGRKLIELCRELGIFLDEQEVYYLTSWLCGKKKADSLLESNMDVGQITEEILKKVEYDFFTDFSQDEELRSSLEKHIVPLLNRLQNDWQDFSPMAQSIQNKYPYAFEIAISATDELSKRLDVFINDTEIAYFALYFELALRRQKVAERKKVLVVCSTGGGIAQLLSYTIRNRFSRRIETIETIDAFHLSDEIIDRYDLVLSTIPVSWPKVHMIPFSLDERDLKSLEPVFEQSGQEILLEDIIRPEYFICGLQAENRTDAMNQMFNRLKNLLKLPENFIELMEEREAMFSTELGSKVAFPHPLHYESPVSFMAVAVLEEPVIWNRKPVQIIFLGCTAKGDSIRMAKAYDQFASLISDPVAISRILQEKTYNALRRELKELKEKRE